MKLFSFPFCKLKKKNIFNSGRIQSIQIVDCRATGEKCWDCGGCFFYTTSSVVCTVIKITGENGRRKERKEPCARASSSAAAGPGSPASRLSSPACHLLAVHGWCAAPGSTPVASPSLQTSVSNQIRETHKSDRWGAHEPRVLLRHSGPRARCMPLSRASALFSKAPSAIQADRNSTIR